VRNLAPGKSGRTDSARLQIATLIAPPFQGIVVRPGPSASGPTLTADSRGADRSSLTRLFFFFQAEDGIPGGHVTGVQTCALPIFQTHALDLGYYVQVVWSIAHGHGAYVTLPPMHAWGDHFSPILYLLAPLGRLAPGGSALVLAQTVVLCSGAVAVFVYAARRLHSVSDAARPAAAFALLYLVNPSLHGTNIRDIHPQAFAITFLVWAAAAFDARRYGWCAFALLLTLGGREDAAIAVVGFGLWLALARRRWALGVTVLAASVLVLLIDLTWVMPYFRGSPYPHLGRYSHLGAS